MLRHAVVDLIRELKRHQREPLLKKNRMFRGAHYGIRHNVVYEPPPYAAREAEPGDLQGGWVEGEHVQRVALCVLLHVHKDVDAVFVEFARDLCIIYNII